MKAATPDQPWYASKPAMAMSAICRLKEGSGTTVGRTTLLGGVALGSLGLKKSSSYTVQCARHLCQDLANTHASGVCSLFML